MLTVFSGIESEAGAEQYAKYSIPIRGLSDYEIGTPVKEFGNDLTITQTVRTNSSITFTVALSSVNQSSSLIISALHFLPPG